MRSIQPLQWGFMRDTSQIRLEKRGFLKLLGPKLLCAWCLCQSESIACIERLRTTVSQRAGVLRRGFGGPKGDIGSFFTQLTPTVAAALAWGKINRT